jgi:hypothetical protein
MTSAPPRAAARSQPIAPARLFRGFGVAVIGELAPLAVKAEPASAVVAQGQPLKLNLSITRRAGFTEAVVATATDLPPNLTAATVTIPKNAQTAALPLVVPKNVPPGIYTFVVRGTGAYPFSKDLKAKTKPNVTLTEPSNSITIIVRPAR